MQRSAMLGAGFGEHERTVREIEGREALPSAHLCSTLSPVQTTCDHQVQNQPEVVLHPDSDTFADPLQTAHRTAFHFLQRRIRRTEQKGTGHTYRLDRLAYKIGRAHD